MSTQTQATRIYDFEPFQLAQTETAMWRAYYDRRPAALFRLSLQLLREQLAFSSFLALLNSYRLTRAAFVFKRGRRREDYQQALRWLVPFYRSAHRRLAAQWSPQTVAVLELEWWIIHRHDFGPEQTDRLELALAQLCAAVYHLPTPDLTEYARHRVEAILLTDEGVRARERGLPVEPNWLTIRQALENSYAALRDRLDRGRAND